MKLVTWVPKSSNFWLLGCSVALVIDNVELFKKLAPQLRDGAKVKFVVLLWGSKSSLDSTNGALLKDIPIHSFDEFIKMGSESSKSTSGLLNLSLH